MDDTKSNAMAELAEDLLILKVILESEHHPKGAEVADKAQRIVSELAKVQWHDNPNTKVGALPDVDSLPNIMVECRAIAEEGVK